MFLSAFWAGSVLPMSSEAVLLALLETGLPPVTLLLCATAGILRRWWTPAGTTA